MLNPGGSSFASLLKTDFCSEVFDLRSGILTSTSISLSFRGIFSLYAQLRPPTLLGGCCWCDKVSNTRLAYEHLPRVCVCVYKDRSTSCAPDVDSTSLLAIPVLNKPHPRDRERTDSDIRPHSPRLLIQACRSPICLWVSLVITHIHHTVSLSHTLLYTLTRFHAPIFPYERNK